MAPRADRLDPAFMQPLLAATVMDVLQIWRWAVQLVGEMHTLAMFEVLVADRRLIEALLRFVVP